MASQPGSAEPPVHSSDSWGADGAGPQHHRGGAQYLAPRLARGILAAVFSGFCLVAFLHILYLPIAPIHVVLSAVYMIAMLSLQLFYFSRPLAQLHSPLGYLALLAQALLVYLPLLEFKQAWVGLPGFLAGSVLLVLPPTLGWISFGLVAASMAVVQGVFTGQPIDVAYTTVSTVISGLVVYGLTRLASLVTELHAAQNELAKMAVAQERLRFARDLHDLLGYSLSAITLKSELTHRLLAKHPARAQEELAEILDISRRALADVRAVASGYRELSLEAESESARSVLVAADIDVRMDVDYGNLPTRVRTVLATVLREGVTNVLRHSKAERCDITVRRTNGCVEIDIVNDGVPHEPLEHISADDSAGGSGIPNLSVRVGELGGRLNAGVDVDGKFRLHATAPVTTTHSWVPTRSKVG